MFSPSVYDHRNMNLIPPSFMDQQGHELPDLPLAPPPVNSSVDVGGPQCVPPDMLIPRNIGSLSSVMNIRRLPVRKDRHSKISTAQGFRERRVRLSVGISRRFFDLQDMLGFDKASKTLEWLLGKSADSIEKLAKTSKDVNNYNEGTNTSPSSTSSFGSLNYLAMSANGKEKKDKLMANVSSQKSTKTIAREESRAKARARARERTREKLLNGHFRALGAQSEDNAHNLPASPSHNVDATGEDQASRCELEVTMQSMVTRGKPSSILCYHHENIVISSSKDRNNFNNVENFFPNLHQPRDINGGINAYLRADLLSMDNLEKLIAANELN